jgi:hypothetical protein
LKINKASLGKKSGLAMGSPLSGLLSNIFIHLMEKTIVNHFLKNKNIIHWQRFVDDVICICRKDSIDLILNKIYSWDAKLNFAVKKLTNNEIKFINAKIFIKNDEIKFRKIFKKGEATIFTNFELSISPYEYVVNNIFTQLHRTRDCCSDESQFDLALDKLRTIFAKNYCPHKLV